MGEGVGVAVLVREVVPAVAGRRGGWSDAMVGPAPDGAWARMGARLTGRAGEELAWESGEAGPLCVEAAGKGARGRLAEGSACLAP